jgi:transcriptional regulator with XRE-family HTH domain
MSTSQNSSLSKPQGSEKISSGTLAYFRARLKHRIFSLILKEFRQSKITKADLARRLGMSPAQLSRTLAGPGNLTTETISDLLWAINGQELEAGSKDPFAPRGIKSAQSEIFDERKSSPVPSPTPQPTASPMPAPIMERGNSRQR